MAQSRIPQTSQTGPHRRLEETVLRHLRHAWQSPVHDYSRRAFGELNRSLDSAWPVVLDSGCGTGVSTVALAQKYPECLVVGIDKSAARLGKSPELPANARLVRADLADLWRLMSEAGCKPAHHYLLYPNPWPKPAHLKRRWHGHPAFPSLLALGGRLELRSNFELYVDEFARALALAGVVDVKVVSFRVDDPISPFERKYLLSGHRLFQLTATLE
ncbi:MULTISPECIES: tRNA (guanosine(46)-N(7))-methyltransferase TrmB [unclassified Wenzhouxiangella]|uniref:tRNA (guanine(46)-N(7))-methyltransferase TrmB n=1 Tax=unclassified Wenzhouxiangella TaxID=2613841 RepID=UPI000E325811|nr:MULTISPECIES: methyltransferase domain-containing protein [unclassified Wenzhouxiangella]RFF26631.1 methyltransferase domain-containing protein [Wenzhouxiangella sp. 15181]RFP67618.1 methyltransferase domain-containing protein [Wenzhouxiangella sp. 15190]